MNINQMLQNDIIEELNCTPQLQGLGTKVNISVHDGMVTLTGLVDSYSKKKILKYATLRVKGVRMLTVNIKVKPPTSAKKSDVEIKQAISFILSLNNNVPPDAIKVDVHEGWVYLRGTVDWEYQKRSAEGILTDVPGIRGITNEIHVKAGDLEVVDIKNRIYSAFNRNVILCDSAIKADAVGDKIILRGSVKTWVEKKEAENIAWSTPGVLDVENFIDINAEFYSLSK